MKVYVLMDHVCEADIVVGVFSSKKLAKEYLRAQKAMDYLVFEGPEIVEWEVDKAWAYSRAS